MNSQILIDQIHSLWNGLSNFSLVWEYPFHFQKKPKTVKPKGLYPRPWCYFQLNHQFSLFGHLHKEPMLVTMWWTNPSHLALSLGLTTSKKLRFECLHTFYKLILRWSEHRWFSKFFGFRRILKILHHNLSEKHLDCSLLLLRMQQVLGLVRWLYLVYILVCLRLFLCQYFSQT